jgi:hypothetical protein
MAFDETGQADMKDGSKFVSVPIILVDSGLPAEDHFLILIFSRLQLGWTNIN